MGSEAWVEVAVKQISRESLATKSSLKCSLPDEKSGKLFKFNSFRATTRAFFCRYAGREGKSERSGRAAGAPKEVPTSLLRKMRL